MDCISEAQLLDMFDDRLAPAQREAIEGHVDDCPECRDLVVEVARGLGSLASPPAEVVSTPSAGLREAGPELGCGSTINDRYVLLDVVGIGGMGIVYAAYDRKLDRKVALKLLRPDVMSVGDAKARLLREAQLVARLSHPNIINVHDAGEVNGQIYIDMEFVEGCNLRQWLAARQRSLAEIVRVFLEAARGLTAAHAAGVIHRDFKPDNVLVGGDGRVRVNDFGLARSLARPDTPSFDAVDLVREPRAELETRAGTRSGTPAYMAPEQRRGEPCTAAADQYAFCVALHEALLGERPLDGSAGRMRDARLAEVLRRGLSPAPQDRFASMEVLGAALAAVNRRRRWPMIAAAGVAAVALGLGLTMKSEEANLCRGASQQFAGVWDTPRKDTLRKAFMVTEDPSASSHFAALERAIDQYAETWIAQYIEACEATRVRAEQSAELLDRRMACLRQSLGGVDTILSEFAEADVAMIERTPDLVASIADPGLCSAAEVLRAQTPLVPLAIRERVEAHHNRVTRAVTLGIAGRHKEALALARETVTEAAALNFSPSEQRAAFALGRAQMLVNAFAEAEASFQRAVLLAESTAQDDSAINAMLALIWATMAQVRYEEAELWIRLTDAKLNRLGESDPRRSNLLHWQGELHLVHDHVAEATAAYEEALALSRRDSTSQPALIAASLNALGNLAFRQGDMDGAMAHFREALEIREREFGPMHSRVAGILNNIGALLTTQCSWGEARRHLERALAIRRRLSGEDNTDIAKVLFNIATLEAGQGHIEQALAVVEESLAITGRFVSEEHPMLINHLTLLSQLRLAQGAADEALALAERARKSVVRHQGAMHLDAGEPSLAVGSAQLALGRSEEAVQTLEQAWAIFNGQPSRVELRARAAFALAQALWEQGARERAREAASWAEATLPASCQDEARALAAWRAAHVVESPP